MATESLKQIVENLAAEEGAEKQLISLYLTLLEAGAERCLPQKMQKKFKNDLDLVYGESIKHQKIIVALLKKYQTKKI